MENRPLVRSAPSAEPSIWAVETPGLGHRTMLRELEIAAGKIYLDLSAEIVSTSRLSTVTPIAFVRENGAIRLADPTGFPTNTNGSDLSSALGRTQLWIFMRERSTLTEAWIPADVAIEAVTDYGRPWSRMVTIRFGARVAWDIPAVIGVHKRNTAWDMFTVLYALGSRSFAHLGAHRDRVAVDPALHATFVPGANTRIEPQLTGLAPRLTLRIEDTAA